VTFEETLQMLNQLAGPYHRELNDWEVRRWVEELRAVKQPVAMAAMRRVHSRDEKFPSIARFLETVKSMRAAEGKRMVEIDGEWVPLNEYLAQIEQEKREWDRTPSTEEQRRMNLQKLDQIFAEHFGRRGKELQNGS